MYKTVLNPLILAGVLTLAASGCVTQQSGKKQGGTLEERISQVEDQVRENRLEIAKLKEQDALFESKVGDLSRTAEEALKRALKAGKLAEGKFLYEIVLREDHALFGFDEYNLKGEAKKKLSGFAWKIKGDDEDVFLEIQGHTDNSGPEAYNMLLGYKRAQEVMRYLNVQHGFPLQRMNVISYGETEPIADNSTIEGRAKNRRVTLVVLK